jgi:transposase
VRALSSNDLLSWQLRAELSQRDATIAQRDATISLLQAELDQRAATIARLQAELDQRDSTIARLQAELDQRAAQGEAAQARIVQLQTELEQSETQRKTAQTRVAELQAQLLRHFKVPPRPPVEGQLPPPKPRHRSRRKRGAQPGHPGHYRALIPIEQVSHVVSLVPVECSRCGESLVGLDPAPAIHQVVEVPPLSPEVTEFRSHELPCAACGTRTRAPLPAGVPRSAFGPRLRSMVAILTGKYHLSKRMVEELLFDFVGVRMSLGSVSELEQTVSTALAPPVAQAIQSLPTAPVVYQDETTWWQQNVKVWLWTAVTALVTVFQIAFSRGKKVCQGLLGQGFGGTLVTDRYSAYLWVSDEQRQFCWAHLMRDFEELEQAGGDGARLGSALWAQGRRMFRYWHRVRDHTLPFDQLDKKLKPVREEVHRLLVDGVRYFTGKAKTLSEQLLLHEEALWHFAKVPGVEPTNNTAERALRQAVLWRKCSFGTQSPEGSVFVERILTVIATLRQQGRNVLEFVTAACQAQLLHQPAPSLLPALPAPPPSC